MKIVVLDGYAMNPGDLSWDGLKSLGTVELYDSTADEQVLERLDGADIAVVNKVVLSGETLRKLPNLKMVAETATGYNNIDIAAAAECGVVVSNVPAYSTESVVQMIFAHILNFTNSVAVHSATVHKGKWEQSEQFCYWDTTQMELCGKTLGIIGFGNIGSALARVASAFGMNVYVNSRSEKVTDIPVKFVDRETLFKESDFIALACALTPDTEKVINRDSLSMMKSSAFLVNTGRGPLIDEADLAEALNEGVIAGAGVDVLTQEPPKDGSPLMGQESCSITPHIAWATVEARTRLLGVTEKNIELFIAGTPQNVIQ